ncbi:sigma-54 dependent transcriptional regulator [Bosea sp. (in: a-proteobacteria)]|uniref:sigma-54-dependent transcriptional regulator n=1 Tax=Bosea sp. (in: a-proteobacteria) TaxID=1871050 RepID=UPI0027325AEB|nr:sigma-54 dependent transcriptional regulator [Bosea sp. (in: a-proteobacteria)]MDP3411310.1 sigma-54 dependent transcriptional regulator [Bosea sp. (in: a-proteobacteria)]
MSLERRSIGVIEDDPIMGESLVQRLGLEGAQVSWWRTKAEAVAGLARRRHHAVICDLKLPDGTGEEIFVETVKFESAPPFLFMTAYGEIDQAVRLMRCGAGDYVTKPFDMTTFLERLDALVDSTEREGEGVLGISPAIRAVERMLLRLAGSSAPVLLTGETGSGKEVCARLLHASRGPDCGPFMIVSCATTPSDDLERKLFGQEKVALDGVEGRNPGHAERVGAGTLFLDDVADLALPLQSKLLRLLESRTFTRVGGEGAEIFRARIVCATHADLPKMVKEGRFREDLFYRINVVTVPLPPLRERPDDIVWLIDRFVAEFAAQSGDRIQGLSALSLEAALAHGWPGNVRELRNRVVRGVTLGDGPLLMPGDLFPERAPPRAPSREGLDGIRDDAERRHIARVLSENGGAVLASAKALGISRTTLWDKMKRLGLGRPAKDGSET